MKRVFIALKVEPGEIMLRIYSSLKAVLGNEKISWVDPENIHLTLAFLGDTEEERITVASIMLKQKCMGFGEFTFTLSGTGVFRSYSDPRVIWIGIGEQGNLNELFESVYTGLKDTGFKTEDRRFNPHITLGRIKFIRDNEVLKAAINRYINTFVQEVTVKELILFESILKQTGPVYKPIGKFSLD